jgi:hypothetical protein
LSGGAAVSARIMRDARSEMRGQTFIIQTFVIETFIDEIFINETVAVRRVDGPAGIKVTLRTAGIALHNKFPASSQNLA